MKNIILILMLSITFNVWSSKPTQSNEAISDEILNTNQSFNWYQTGEVVYFSQNYQDKITNESITSTQRITFEDKDQAFKTEVILQTQSGLKVFSAKQLVNELYQEKSTGETPAQLKSFVEIMDNPMVARVGAQLAYQQRFSLKRGGCGAASAYVAFTWSQFVDAVVAGNASAADYWLFENSWAISEMRIYCQIK